MPFSCWKNQRFRRYLEQVGRWHGVVVILVQLAEQVRMAHLAVSRYIHQLLELWLRYALRQRWIAVPVTNEHLQSTNSPTIQTFLVGCVEQW